MNWDAIGAAGEVFGALAVIATLIYLAQQIKHSLSLARAEQNKGVMESYTGWNELIVSNPEVAEILGKEPDSELSRLETIQIRHLAYRLIDIYNIAEFSYSNGQLSEQEFDAYKEDFDAMIGFYPMLLIAMQEIMVFYPKSMQKFKIYESLRSGEL